MEVTLKKREWIKIVFSILIVYHLATVLLMPIGGSLVGRKLAGFFLPYANTLNFNTTWQFFSPGPSPMFYLEYDVDTAAELADQSIASEPHQYPDPHPPYSWSDSWNRRLYGMRFFALNPERLARFFVPYLCDLHPEAIEISVRPVFERIEDLDRAAKAQSLWSADFKDMSERIDMPRERFRCPQANGGAGT